LTETAPNNLIFSSDYNTLKYYSSGDIVVTVDYADYYYTEEWLGIDIYYHRKVSSIQHGLGYVPYFTSYIEGFAMEGRYNMCPGTFADVFYYAYAQSYADDDKIYFVMEIRNDSNSGTIESNFSYKIFKNNLGL